MPLGHPEQPHANCSCTLCPTFSGVQQQRSQQSPSLTIMRWYPRSALPAAVSGLIPSAATVPAPPSQHPVQWAQRYPPQHPSEPQGQALLPQTLEAQQRRRCCTHRPRLCRPPLFHASQPQGQALLPATYAGLVLPSAVLALFPDAVCIDGVTRTTPCCSAPRHVNSHVPCHPSCGPAAVCITVHSELECGAGPHVCALLVGTLGCGVVWCQFWDQVHAPSACVPEFGTCASILGLRVEELTCPCLQRRGSFLPCATSCAGKIGAVNSTRVRCACHVPPASCSRLPFSDRDSGLAAPTFAQARAKELSKLEALWLNRTTPLKEGVKRTSPPRDILTSPDTWSAVDWWSPSNKSMRHSVCFHMKCAPCCVSP